MSALAWDMERDQLEAYAVVLEAEPFLRPSLAQAVMAWRPATA